MRGPWVIAADWNCTPQEIAETAWIKQVQGVIVAPTQTTCNDRTIDFFVVSKRIAHAVYAIYRLEDSNVSPHYGVRMLLRSDARRHRQRVLVKPPKVEESRLGQGPADLKGERFIDDLQTGTVTMARIADSLREFSVDARAYFGMLNPADKVTTRKGSLEPYFKWQTAAGPKASPHAGKSRVAAIWHVAANRTRDAARLLRAGGFTNLYYASRQIIAVWAQLVRC